MKPNNKISRRSFLKGTAAVAASMAISGLVNGVNAFAEEDDNMSTVYYSKEISPEALVRIYEALGRELTGKVAVKISTGESAKSNHLRPELIGDLVKKLDGTIVECCTAYGGNRQNIRKHWQTIEERGYKNIADVDIMDEFGEFSIPIKGGFHLDEDIVGSGLKSYDSVLILSHFKGHARGGYGGVLKNQSIGVASRKGKCNIHTAGLSTTSIHAGNSQDSFLESMAAAAQAVHNYFKQPGRDIVYIDVMNNLSVDCDCNPNPAPPEIEDIGILASTDPIALDRACLDLIFNMNPSPGNDPQPLINRITELHGTHIVEYAEQIGLGTQAYNLIDIDVIGIEEINQESPDPETLRYNVFTIDGKKILHNAKSLESLKPGVYIINGKKQLIVK